MSELTCPVSISFLSLEAFTSLSITHSQFFPSLPSNAFLLNFFTTDSTLSSSIPLLSHLNSSPRLFLLKFFVSFCYRSCPYFLFKLLPFISFHTPTPSPPIPFFSFSITIFPFFLRHLMLVQFTRKRGRHAQACEIALKLGCVAKKNTTATQLYSREDIIFFLYSLVRFRIMKRKQVA
jgi:hypothetical protein